MILPVNEFTGVPLVYLRSHHIVATNWSIRCSTTYVSLIDSLYVVIINSLIISTIVLLLVDYWILLTNRKKTEKTISGYTFLYGLRVSQTRRRIAQALFQNTRSESRAYLARRAGPTIEELVTFTKYDLKPIGM